MHEHLFLCSKIPISGYFNISLKQVFLREILIYCFDIFGILI